MFSEEKNLLNTPSSTTIVRARTNNERIRSTGMKSVVFIPSLYRITSKSATRYLPALILTSASSLAYTIYVMVSAL